MSSSDAMATSDVTASPRPTEGAGVEEQPSQPSTSENNAKVGTEPHLQHESGKAPDQRTVSAIPPFFNEIRLLQERLLYLEDQAAQHWKASVEESPSEERTSGEQAKHSDSAGRDGLRKHIRKAPSSRRWVEKVEQHVEEAADERKYYGQSANEAEIGHATSTMYNIKPDGSMFLGNERQALQGQEGWWNTHGLPFPGSLASDAADLYHRHDQRPLPHRGVHPSTAIHPFYEKPVRKGWLSKEVPPLRLSRKLGPPTRWDASDADDSSEWSSDTSTRSEDFKYFRARLRGDFEWELDRLNAQVLRYRKHLDNKKSRRLALAAQEDNERRHEELGTVSQRDDLLEKLELDAEVVGEDEHGIRRLNLLVWSAFKSRRALPLQHSFVIDVLIEEPKISSDVQEWGQGRRGKKQKNHPREVSKAKPQAAEDMSSTGNTAQSSEKPALWTEQDPLPERIRINSKRIIDVLSDIHGSPLCLPVGEVSSVTLLRPFRILNVYDKDIREICSRLKSGDLIEPEKPSPVEDKSQKGQPKSGVLPEKELVERSPISIDKPIGAEEEKRPNVQEDQSIQLEHLECLRQFMDEYVGKKLSYLNGVGCSKIFFSDVWHLFQPGTTVISSDGKQAYRVINIKSKRHKGADRWAAFWDHIHKKKPRKTQGGLSSSGSSSDSSDELTDNTRADITIICVFIHFDGASFGPVTRTFHLNKWDGEKEVTYLDVYPIRFHILKHLDKRSLTSSVKISTSMREHEVEQGMQVLRQKLIDRGRVFLDVANVKQMYYSGLTIDTKDEIESQVMVDFEEALAHPARQNWAPKIARLVGTNWKSKTNDADEGCTAECCWQENVHDDAYVETRNTGKFIDDMMAEIKDIPHKLPSVMIYPRTLEEMKTESNTLTDDELMILSYSVFGFVLRDRTWAKLDLDCMPSVRSPGNATEQTDDDLEEGGQGAFGQLVLPPGHKKMVLSLISQHFRSKGSQEGNDKQVDIVRGKGKGLIILLHGAPGVGKTTTAEGVAETFGQPLFQITCGDLGSNPKDVETALQTNFALANRWGCILLLDEADVFLAERRREDFNRNGLVAVFLRVLEYYAGILFLTTNRIGDFDEAFASRIHMSLHYPMLDEVSTAKVFRLNLGLIKSRLQDRVKIEEDEIITAAGKHWREHKHARWNGRQIRNACQTALALAEFDAQPKGKKYDIKEKSTAKIHLKLSHLEIVSNAYLEFTDYLTAVHGADAEGRAKESGLRALDTLLDALKSDKAERRRRDRRSSSGERGHTGQETSFQGFRLRPSSSGQRPAPRMPSPSSPEPASQHLAGHQVLYSPQRLAHEPASGPAQRMQYNQSAYMGNQQFMGDQPSGLHPTTQHVQPGSYLQAPQSYTSAGRGDHGHYQSSDPYMHESQPLRGHGVSYPSPPPSSVRGGPVSGSTSVGHFGDDQSRQGHLGGQVPYNDSEQI